MQSVAESLSPFSSTYIYVLSLGLLLELCYFLLSLIYVCVLGMHKGYLEILEGRDNMSPDRERPKRTGPRQVWSVS
jgi:hypothetical protein